LSKEPDEATQAQFIKLQWLDIERNADTRRGVGNSIGGTLFEWSDEWWKSNETLAHTWSVQDPVAHWSSGAFYSDFDVPGHMNMNEEWWGVVRLESKAGSGGPNQRVPKEVYAVLKSLWTRKT
jgi:beta-glucuronidase